MKQMIIESPQYVSLNGENIAVTATIDGQALSVPLDPANRHYAEIIRQVEAGELVIQEAES